MEKGGIIMEFKILEIKVMENGANVRLCFIKKDKFKKIFLNEPIWKGKKMHPAAFLINQSIPAALQVNVHLNGKSRGGKYKLCAYYGDTLMFSSRPKKLPHELKKVRFTVQAKFKAGDFFKVAGNLLSWKLLRNNKPVSILHENIDLELYWIYKENHLFFKRGIPVEILRGIARGFMFTGQTRITRLDNSHNPLKLEHTTGSNPGMSKIIVPVVYCCFFFNPPCYDIRNGSRNYTRGSYTKMTFELKKYLKSIEHPHATCNCDDQAAVLQVFLKAVGIPKVKIGSVPTSFYLKLTNLVGRGLCNNPKFAGPPSGVLCKMFTCCLKECNPITARGDKHRTEFDHHAFCYLGNGNNREQWPILDSCVGPHTGSEKYSEYYDNISDKSSDKLFTPQPFNGVTKIDWVTGWKTRPEFPLTKKFIEKMYLTDKVIKKPVDRFVVCSWPDPRECPALAKKGWEMRFEDIIPGNNGVLKSWILYKEETCIDIELYISSRKDTSAMFRFLEIGSNTDFSELPYKKGPCRLGQHSARSIICSCIKNFWIYHNVVFNIICHNVEKKKVKKLIKWLYKFAKVHIKEDIDKYLPSIADITCSKTKPKVGKTVTVNMIHQDNILHDFIFSEDDKYESDGLHLIDETEDSLVFEAVKKSDNKLVVVAVDKNTLLVNKKEFIIQVTNN
jgi:hypothetical protein